MPRISRCNRLKSLWSGCDAALGADRDAAPSSSGQPSCTGETQGDDGGACSAAVGSATGSPPGRQTAGSVGTACEEEEKKRRTRIRNRENAQNSRRRKKMMQEEIDKKTQRLEGENRSLWVHIASLQAENAALHHQLSTLCFQLGLQPPQRMTPPLGIPPPPWAATPKLPLPPLSRPTAPATLVPAVGAVPAAPIAATVQRAPSPEVIQLAHNADSGSSGSDRTWQTSAGSQGTSSGSTQGQCAVESGLGRAEGHCTAHGTISGKTKTGAGRQRDDGQSTGGPAGPLTKRVKTTAAAAVLATLCTMAAFISPLPLRPAALNGAMQAVPSLLQYPDHVGAANSRSLAAIGQDQMLPALPPSGLNGGTGGVGEQASRGPASDPGAFLGQQPLMLEDLTRPEAQKEQALTEELALGKLKDMAPLAVIMSEGGERGTGGLAPDLGGWANFSDLAKETFLSAGLHSPASCDEVFRLDASSLPDAQAARRKLRAHFASLALFRGRSTGPLALPPIGESRSEEGEGGGSERSGWRDGGGRAGEGGTKPVVGSGNWSEGGVVVSVLVPARDSVGKSGVLSAVHQIYIVVLRPLATYITFACSLQQPVFV
eukprot:evm.model.scf_667.3 EVM.evm.TU.scf_667.3   scf_667:23575-26474(-)